MTDTADTAAGGAVPLCRLAEIPDGGALGFNPPPTGSHPLFAVRRGACVFVYRDECPHEGTPLAWRRHAYLSADGQQIVCFAHGARFEIDTGLCIEGPCRGARLRSVPFEIDADGGIRLIA